MSERKMAANTFNKGLQMDVNPMNTPNDVMTSCLNGTLLTYNGNEFMLQTDMGNGRVETAYLPEGYIPLGITEFGGIIYVVSYNPLINKCQIGSFPSPERNISTDELNKSVTRIDNSDFGFVNNNDGANTFYVQKDLYIDKLTPGDKFIVYTGKGGILSNNGKLFNFPDGGKNAIETENGIETKCVELYIATITNEGKIVRLSDIKTYEIKDGDVSYGEYIIPEISYNSDGNPNIDSYRNLIKSPYNIFNSKVSGKLLLIAELITIDEFNVSISCEFEGDDSNTKKDIKIFVNISYTSNLNVFLKGVLANIVDSNGGEYEKSFIWNKLSIEESSMIENNRNCNALMYEVIGYDYQNRPERNIKYNITPCMPFGKIGYLSRSGIIQLDKIGTGYIELYEWRYYIDNSSIMINWALQSYPEEGYMIAGVRFIMSCYDEIGNINTCIYDVSRKQSYNGSFTENIPFDSDYYKLSEGKLIKNRLYYVTIEIQYCKISDFNENQENIDSSRFRYIHKWMYTTDIFNKQYIEGNIVDFSSLVPNVNIVSENTLYLEKVADESIEYKDDAKITSDESIDKMSTISAIQYYNKYSVVGGIKLGVEDDNLLVLDTNTCGFGLSISRNDATMTIDECTISSDNEVTLEAKDLLTIEVNESWNGNKTSLPSNNKDLTNDIYNNSVWANDVNKSYNNGDVQISRADNINFNIIEYVKAYCDIARKTISWESEIRPIVGSLSDLSQYNIDYVSGTFKNRILPNFGANDEGGVGDDPRIKIGVIESKTNYGAGNDLSAKGTYDLLGDDFQTRIKDRWSAALGSSIINVCWAAYDDDDDCSGGISNHGNTTKKPYSGWAYKMLDGDDSKMWFYKTNGSGGNNYITPEQGQMTMMKTNEGKYVVINMLSRTDNNGEEFLDIPLKPSVGGIGTSNSFYIRNLQTCYVTMLIQLYKYVSEGSTKVKYMPSSYYYDKRVVSSYNLKININPNTNESTKLYIKTNNDNKIYIDKNMMDSLFGKNKQITNNKNDVSDESQNMINNISFSYSSNNSSTVLKGSSIRSAEQLISRYESSMQTNYKTMVICNDGSMFETDQIFNPEVVYSVDSKSMSVSKLNSSFQLYCGNINLSDDGETLLFDKKDIPTSKKGAYNNKLMIKDNQLVLNTTGTGESEATMKSIVFQCNEAPGRYEKSNLDELSFSGFSTFAPFDKLKFFE